jgi:hypothetical protein
MGIDPNTPFTQSQDDPIWRCSSLHHHATKYGVQTSTDTDKYRQVQASTGQTKYRQEAYVDVDAIPAYEGRVPLPANEVASMLGGGIILQLHHTVNTVSTSLYSTALQLYRKKCKPLRSQLTGFVVCWRRVRSTEGT